MITTEKQARKEFWNQHPELKEHYFEPGRRQNDYNAEVRGSFVNWIDSQHRNGNISDQLAAKVTLNPAPGEQRPAGINIDKQEFLQDVESVIDHLQSPDAPEPEDAAAEMQEFQDKLIELASIHRKLKLMGY